MTLPPDVQALRAAPFNLAAHVLAAGATRPDHNAMQIIRPTGAERWSYGRLIAAIRGTGTRLLAQGLVPGDRVLLRLGNGPAFPLAYLGAIAAGLVPVVTSAGLTIPEITAMALPLGCRLTVADAASIASAHAVEIYNHGCATGCDLPDGFSIADLLLTEGRDLTLIATDDAHFTEPDHFGGWVMVKATENTPEALLAALKAGAFYSSQGPELRDIRLEAGRVVVESSAVVTVIVQGQGTAARALHGLSMTRAELTLERFAASPWLRVTVIDAGGKRAWSNPMPNPAFGR